ncbi:hypothetical protein HELRODRAFT_161993 [Helobdella robusta]|uniref:Large ribosomal subunit protein mL52 n=1 Tax=Helobdella robusta TaxID=6412 RepID=T1ES47_HELRO|nr:hypothetical protein HELRODRAFT_161993 [Helobdella robusta]ESO02699.1 hypothetical protein HELRODRAFT_161993 [Helobdella robusta]
MAIKVIIINHNFYCNSYLTNAFYRHGLGKCGNEYGPLVEVPDWSYADGRPAPIAENEQKRRLRNKALAETAVRYIKEMNEAKESFVKKIPIEGRVERPKIYPLVSSKQEKNRY